VGIGKFLITQELVFPAEFPMGKMWKNRSRDPIDFRLRV
jgi:hypothetical protein